jgi:hypothetical protein
MSALSGRIKAVEPSTYSNSETAIEAKVVLLGDSGASLIPSPFPIFLFEPSVFL